uniref:Uncharacterized protein n=1 Tax=Anguilla anguilla TaxID=7936 RepID=A0A0E9UM53_ANGAN
MQELSALLSV